MPNLPLQPAPGLAPIPFIQEQPSPMPKPPTQRRHSTRYTPHPFPSPDAYQAGYQQALTDFAIAPLLQHLQTHFDPTWVNLTPTEAEAIAGEPNRSGDRRSHDVSVAIH
ncbi:MAG: hypothetical protein VKL39_09590 [Leptolyngbyaceae bacterium]|nr:hypothetical protein [Leptolyngbyaceae bacterium]